MTFQHTTAIVLAAGRGTRMGGELPKVLCEVNGKPMITYLLDTLQSVGITEPIIVVGDRQEMVRAALADYPVTFVDQGTPQGTGHAVLAAKSAVAGGFDRAFLLYGDTPFVQANTLKDVYESLNDEAVACSLVTAPKTEQTERFGRIIRNEHGDLKEIVEYKNATDEEKAVNEVNVGGYCARLPWLWQALEQVEPNPVNGEYYLTDIVRIAVDEGRRVVPVMTTVEESHGVDTPELLAHANKLVAQRS